MASPAEYYEEVRGRWGKDAVFGHVDVQQACWSPFSSTKMEHFPKMDNFDLTYLNSISDTSQYPASQCAMGENIYMYRHMASSGAESMNAAYKEVHARTAMDCLNVCIALTNHECVRFLRHKEQAWQMESVLTPAGVEELTSIVHEISDTIFGKLSRNRMMNGNACYRGVVWDPIGTHVHSQRISLWKVYL